HGAVLEMDRQSDRPPGPAAGERLAEQLDIVVLDTEDPLVERHLSCPDAACDCAGKGPPDRAGTVDRHLCRKTVTAPGDPGIQQVAQETDHPCSQAALAPRRSYDAAPYHAQAAGRGVNLALYVVVRACMQPFFHVYFRMRRTGMHHIPKTGPVIFAANHRSFLDPFVIGMLTRRPVYYVAKRELFENPVQAWLLNRLGAFPVERGESDERSMSTARAVLARGDCLVIFPEGTRIRGGPLHSPKRGVGRLALETGAPIVPVAVIGTDR